MSSKTQADVRGAQILAASGYTPADMVGFFNTLAKVDTARKTTWLSNHPAPPDRIARIEKERQLLREPATPTQNVAQLTSIQRDLRGHGNAPTMAQIAQGATSNPPMTSGTTNNSGSIGRVPAPSSSFKQYSNRNGAYQIAYPSNWRVYDSGGFGVTIAPEGGVGTVSGRTEVVYGLIVNHYEPSGNATRQSLRSTGSVTLQSATNDLIAQVQQTSPHLRVVSGSGQQLQLDGRTALAASLRGTNPNTRLSERVTLVTRALGDGHLIYMVFVTPEAEAKNYSGVLNKIVQSVNVAEGTRH